VAVDPNSIHSPSLIFDTWRNHSSMSIIEWTDHDYTKRKLTYDSDQNVTKARRFALYLERQSTFVSACAKHIHDNVQGASWALFVDTDEFLAINGDTVANVESYWMKKPGSVLELLEHFANTTSNRVINATIPANPKNLTFRSELPGKPPSFWYEYFQKSLCREVGRNIYSADESSDNDLLKYLPQNMTLSEAKKFDTFRYRYRRWGRQQPNKLGKSLIDLSRIMKQSTGMDDAMRWRRSNVHEPLPSFCKKTWLPCIDSPFCIHHYKSSWENYSSRRNDHRRTYHQWATESKGTVGTVDNEICPWLGGFIEMVGHSVAKKLLNGAGERLPNN
jgi:hypothetical protein